VEDVVEEDVEEIDPQELKEENLKVMHNKDKDHLIVRDLHVDVVKDVEELEEMEEVEIEFQLQRMLFRISHLQQRPQHLHQHLLLLNLPSRL